MLSILMIIHFLPSHCMIFFISSQLYLLVCFKLTLFDLNQQLVISILYMNLMHVLVSFLSSNNK